MGGGVGPIDGAYAGIGIGLIELCVGEGGMVGERIDQ